MRFYRNEFHTDQYCYSIKGGFGTIIAPQQSNARGHTRVGMLVLGTGRKKNVNLKVQVKKVFLKCHLLLQVV